MDAAIDQLDLRRVWQACLKIQFRRVARGIALEDKLGKVLPQVSRDVELLFRMVTTNLHSETGEGQATFPQELPSEQKTGSMSSCDRPRVAEILEEFRKLDVSDRSLVLEAAEKSLALKRLRAGGEGHDETESETFGERESETPGN